MRTPFRMLLPATLVLFALALLAGCGDDSGGGGSDGADADPEVVLATALGDEGEPIESGVLDLSVDIESSGATAGSLSGSLSGPFVGGGDSALPQLDFEAAASVDAGGTTIDFDGGLTLTEDSAYVTYDGTDYEVDAETFALLQQSYEQSAQLQESQADQGSLEAFGIDPASWISDLSNEGTEDLDGTEVIHVSGTADVGKIVDDLQSVAEQSGQAAELDEAGLQQAEESVTNATIDVYADAEDNTLRRLDLDLELASPAGGDATTVSLSVGIADPNSDQEISAPEDAQPIAELLGQIPGGAAALGGLGSTGVAPSTGGGAVAEDYYECAAQATSEKDLEACAELAVP